MICNTEELITKLRKSLSHNKFWKSKLAVENTNQFALHLAIMREPYLTFIMDKRKTVETRFAKHRCAPFEKVRDGDVVLLKRVGGDITGAYHVAKVWYYRLDPQSLTDIRKRFEGLICPANDSFWSDRISARVATLMLIEHVVPVNCIQIEKRDRRGWVVLGPEERQLSFKP